MRKYEVEITIYARVSAEDKRQAKSKFAKLIQNIKTKEVQTNAIAWEEK